MQAAATLLRKAWLSRNLLTCLLWPLTLVSRAWLILSHLRDRLGWRPATPLPVPVWVVGNVLVGGTGKTPIVIHLSTHLQSLGFKTGVIARAVGCEDQSTQEVRIDSHASQVGDEALLIKHRTLSPVFVGRARALAAQALLQAYPDTQLIISDDGLQHHALHHDLALCVFDDRGLGNGWLLPAGPLRETWPRKTRGAVQYLVHTGKYPFENSYPAARQLSTHAVNGLGQTRPLSAWAAKPVQALAAIAQPEVFFAALRDQGLPLLATHALPDHAPLDDWTTVPGEDLLCTEKDAVKLWPHNPQAWAVPLECRLPDVLWAQLLQNLQALSSPHGQKTA
jgi:tetraacyldisaccharide 4'-kinase